MTSEPYENASQISHQDEPNEDDMYKSDATSYCSYSSYEQSAVTLVSNEPSSSRSDNRAPLEMDWNQRFQKLNESTSSDKYGLLSQLALDFVYTAKLYGKIICTEVGLPDYKKTIQPTRVGGFAGGEKYIAGGMFFKFAFDSRGIYGGDENASKAAGHELKGLSNFYDCHVPNVSLPLMALIDYNGFRLIALPLLPINHDTLCYGAITVRADPAVCDRMKQVSKMLNLRSHYVGKKTPTLLHLAADIEEFLGHSIDRGSMLCQLLRPELVKSFHTPLSPDALCKMTSPEVLLREVGVGEEFSPKAHARDIMEATEYLYKGIVPAFAEFLDEHYGRPSTTTKLRIIHELHKRGINVRHIGRLRYFCQNPTIRSKLLLEMSGEFLIPSTTRQSFAARAFKCIFRHDSREQMRKNNSASIEVNRTLAADLLNQAIRSDFFWSHRMVDKISTKFRDGLTATEMSNEFSLRSLLFSSPKEVTKFLKRTQQITGIKIKLKSYKKLELSSRTGIHRHDVYKLSARVKFMNIVDYAVAMDAFEQASQTSGEEREELLEISDSKFRAALDHSANSTVILYQWGCMLYSRAMARNKGEVSGHVITSDLEESTKKLSACCVLENNYVEGHIALTEASISTLMAMDEYNTLEDNLATVERLCNHTQRAAIQAFKLNCVDNENPFVQDYHIVGRLPHPGDVQYAGSAEWILNVVERLVRICQHTVTNNPPLLDKIELTIVLCVRSIVDELFNLGVHIEHTTRAHLQLAICRCHCIRGLRNTNFIDRLSTRNNRSSDAELRIIPSTPTFSGLQSFASFRSLSSSNESVTNNIRWNTLEAADAIKSLISMDRQLTRRLVAELVPLSHRVKNSEIMFIYSLCEYTEAPQLTEILSPYIYRLVEIILDYCTTWTERQLAATLPYCENLRLLSIKCCHQVRLQGLKCQVVEWLDCTGCVNVGTGDCIAEDFDLPSLRRLNLSGCPQVNEKFLQKITSSTPLHFLGIEDVPLRYLEAEHLTDLQDISAKRCRQLQSFSVASVILQALDFTDCTSLVAGSIKNPRELTDLIFDGCTLLREETICAILKDVGAHFLRISLRGTRVGLPLLRLLSKQCPKLEQLSIAGTKTVNPFQLLQKNQLPKLLRLDVTGCSGGPAMLEQFPRLRRLTMTQYDMPSLSENCAAHPALVELSIGRCSGISEISVKHMLSHLPMLRTFRLAQCAVLSDEVLSHLSKVCPNLEEIELFGSYGFTDKGVTELSSLHNLKILSLRGCNNVSDYSIVPLVVANPNLESLDLAVTKVQNKGLQAIVENCPSLTFLDVSSTISPLLSSSWETICKMTQLTQLSAIASEICDMDLRNLLRQLHRLKSIQLAHCSALTDLAFEELDVNRLESVNLTENSNITDFTLKQLARYCPSLRDIQIDNCNRITKKGLSIIVEKCPKTLHYLHLLYGVLESFEIFAASMSAGWKDAGRCDSPRWRKRIDSTWVREGCCWANPSFPITCSAFDGLGCRLSRIPNCCNSPREGDLSRR
ncbi:hypothetical protein PROFUN_05661 [Planoprotostelium fungivorum]|uniref:Clu domain-containing protein n=1 Tax=Planoprotostelium fungivorum TaxID=1890364 RepID=A0A2P6MUG9_9EUKA|nr:hypothetical protein PROFUN_05661 [Planoprotostelium fungivorum]